MLLRRTVRLHVSSWYGRIVRLCSMLQSLACWTAGVDRPLCCETTDTGPVHRVVCLLKLPLSPVPNYCLVTDAHGCEQLAQGYYPTAPYLR